MSVAGPGPEFAEPLDCARDAVLLVAHGTVETLDELPELLTNIRRGHPPPPELLAEIKRRYEAIGGRSPLNAINREVAKKLEPALGVPVAFANRLARPYPKDVLVELAARGAKRVIVVPLAQHSAAVYGDSVEAAARDLKLDVLVEVARNWGRSPALTDAFARRVVAALEAADPAQAHPRTTIVMTAHSLPTSVIDAGDPYADEVRASADLVAARVRELSARAADVDFELAFQSQGMSKGAGGRPMAWLGPDLRACFSALAARGTKHVVVAPIGFLADHVEILYDIDIEARGWAEQVGMTLSRAASLDASDDFIAVLADVTRTAARRSHEAHEGER